MRGRMILFKILSIVAGIELCDQADNTSSLVTYRFDDGGSSHHGRPYDRYDVSYLASKKNSLQNLQSTNYSQPFSYLNPPKRKSKQISRPTFETYELGFQRLDNSKPPWADTSQQSNAITYTAQNAFPYKNSDVQMEHGRYTTDDQFAVGSNRDTIRKPQETSPFLGTNKEGTHGFYTNMNGEKQITGKYSLKKVVYTPTAPTVRRPAIPKVEITKVSQLKSGTVSQWGNSFAAGQCDNADAHVGGTFDKECYRGGKVTSFPVGLTNENSCESCGVTFSSDSTKSSSVNWYRPSKLGCTHAGYQWSEKDSAAYRQPTGSDYPYGSDNIKQPCLRPQNAKSSQVDWCKPPVTPLSSVSTSTKWLEKGRTDYGRQEYGWSGGYTASFSNGKPAFAEPAHSNEHPHRLTHDAKPLRLDLYYLKDRPSEVAYAGTKELGNKGTAYGRHAHDWSVGHTALPVDADAKPVVAAFTLLPTQDTTHYDNKLATEAPDSVKSTTSSSKPFSQWLRDCNVSIVDRKIFTGPTMPVERHSYDRPNSEAPSFTGSSTPYLKITSEPTTLMSIKDNEGEAKFRDDFTYLEEMSSEGTTDSKPTTQQMELSSTTTASVEGRGDRLDEWVVTEKETLLPSQNEIVRPFTAAEENFSKPKNVSVKEQGTEKRILASATELRPELGEPQVTAMLDVVRGVNMTADESEPPLKPNPDALNITVNETARSGKINDGNKSLLELVLGNLLNKT